MQLITNTSEFTDFVKQGNTDIVQFPVNTNLLLGGETLSAGAAAALERVARAAGRALHLC